MIPIYIPHRPHESWIEITCLTIRHKPVELCVPETRPVEPAEGLTHARPVELVKAESYESWGHRLAAEAPALCQFPTEFSHSCWRSGQISNLAAPLFLLSHQQPCLLILQLTPRIHSSRQNAHHPFLPSRVCLIKIFRSLQGGPLCKQTFSSQLSLLGIQIITKPWWCNLFCITQLFSYVLSIRNVLYFLCEWWFNIHGYSVPN